MKVYVPTFYALNDTRTPVRISLIAVFSNLFISLILVFAVLPEGYRFVGLALGTSVSVTLSYLLLARSFHQRLGSLRRYQVMPTLLKAVVAAAVMGILVWLLNRFFQELWEEMNSWQELVSLVTSIAVGIISYFGCCHVMNVKEIRILWAWVKP